jgi:hypothetical protein
MKLGEGGAMSERQWTMMAKAWEAVSQKLKSRGLSPSEIDLSLKRALAAGRIRSMGSPKQSANRLVIKNIIFHAVDVIDWMKSEHSVQMDISELEPLYFAKGRPIQGPSVH